MQLLVGIIMGSIFDWEIMKNVCDIFDEFNVLYEKKVVFVYWMFDFMFEYVEIVRERGIKVIIVGVGGVVYFLGMMVVKIILLVIGVLVQFKVLNGLDLFFFIV